MDARKEKILVLIDKLKDAIEKDNYDFYKYFMADLFDELIQLKTDQIKNNSQEVKNT